MARTVLIDLRRLMRGFGRSADDPLNPLFNAFDRWFTGVNEAYPRLISRALDNKGMVGLIVVASVVLAA